MISYFTINPNPVNDYLDIKSFESEINSIVITDNHGKILINKSVNDSFNYKINVSDWSNGTYFVKVKLLNNRSQISKFVVIH